MLKATIESLDAVPEQVREFYEPKDGKFTLRVEGVVPKTRLDEFRDTNIALKRQLEELTTRFDGVDPEKYRELSDKAQRERDRKLIDAGKVDELVNERVSSMKAAYETQIQARDAELAKSRQHLESLVIDNGIRDAAAKAGVRPTAIEDVLLRGRTLFRLQDGKAVPMDGDKPIYGKNGDPMMIDEWVSSLSDRAPHLFEQSTGAGSRNASGNANPGAGRVSRTDPKGFLDNLQDIAAGKVTVV